MPVRLLQPLVALSWLASVAALVGFTLLQGITLNSSIMALLPVSEQQPIVQQASDQLSKRFSNRLVILLSGDSHQELQSSVNALAVDLEVQTGVANVVRRAGAGTLSHNQQLFPYRHVLLDEHTRELLSNKQNDIVAQQALVRVFDPLTANSLNLIEDPFSLFDNWQSSLIKNLKIDTSSGYLTVINTPKATYMLVVELSEDPFSSAVQTAVLDVTAAHQALMESKAISMDMSGMILHAAAGAEQAEAEMTTIGAGSLLGIILLVLWVFTGLRSLWLLLLPVVLGCATAVAMTVQVFGSIHVITLTFGAGLVGVSIDYAMHFLCERRVAEVTSVARKLLPGLALGLFSSVIAYAAQGLAPFPGLQQMAFFAVVGLSAAWVSVWLLLPWLTRNDKIQPLKVVKQMRKFRLLFPSLGGSRGLQIIMVVVLCASAISLWKTQGKDDVRLLQTSPSELIAEEQRVQTVLQSDSSSHFIIVQGADIEAVLQKEELLRTRLDKYKQQEHLVGYRALTQILPSLKRQEENLAFIENLYQEQLPAMYQRLGLTPTLLKKAENAFQKEQNLLSVEQWKSLNTMTQWRPLLLEHEGQSVATLITLGSGLSVDEQKVLAELSDSTVNVIYLDRVKNLSDVLSTYRNEISFWLVLAYLLVFAVLSVRYKRAVWRIILPPLLASLLSLSLVAEIEQGINLFNLMALILVLGIGLDMGIFLHETKGSDHTWVAVSISALTSLLAFGLLSFSQTPVLHHFGITVLFGLLLVWLLTLIVQPSEWRKSC